MQAFPTILRRLIKPPRTISDGDEPLTTSRCCSFARSNLREVELCSLVCNSKPFAESTEGAGKAVGREPR